MADDNPFMEEPTIKKGKSGIIIDFIQTIVIALAIVVVIYLFIAIPNQVEGSSMEPNFQHNQLLLTNKIIQFIGDTSLGDRFDYDYRRGDVIIFQQTGKPDFIKRIVATEGDTISIENGKPVVNGKTVDEKYITEQTYGSSFLKDGETKRVPEGSYFVMGDNRDNSKDSRFVDVGFVDRDDVKGRVFLRYWPLNKFQLIKQGEFEEIENIQ